MVSWLSLDNPLFYYYYRASYPQGEIMLETIKLEFSTSRIVDIQV